MSFLYTFPSLSIVLSPGGKVVSMIVPPDDGGYRPFDPANPRSLPQSKLFDTSGYREALRVAKGD